MSRRRKILLAVAALFAVALVYNVVQPPAATDDGTAGLSTVAAISRTSSAPVSRSVTSPAPTSTAALSTKPKPPLAEGQITRDAYAAAGKTWPFTVDSVIVRCANAGDGGAVTVTTADGTTYAVNGTAMTLYPDMPAVDPIWAPNPDIEGTKINLGDVIDQGVAAC